MINGRLLHFGVTGSLYQRNAVYYDHETGSLWSQILAESVAGPMAGAHLNILPAENASWGAWRKAHPQTTVLSPQTGYGWDYRRDPYRGYPISRQGALLVTDGHLTRIYPFARLKKMPPQWQDDWAGGSIEIVFDRRARKASAQALSGAKIESFTGFLHDLEEFYPQAAVFGAKPKRK